MQTSFYEAQKQKQGGVISFAREEAFLVLPAWKVNLSGSISLSFRTNENNGLLMFNGGRDKVRVAYDPRKKFVYFRQSNLQIIDND